jgi:hypothetical protein
VEVLIVESKTFSSVLSLIRGCGRFSFPLDYYIGSVAAGAQDQEEWKLNGAFKLGEKYHRKF